MWKWSHIPTKAFDSDKRNKVLNCQLISAIALQVMILFLCQPAQLRAINKKKKYRKEREKTPPLPIYKAFCCQLVKHNCWLGVATRDPSSTNVLWLEAVERERKRERETWRCCNYDQMALIERIPPHGHCVRGRLHLILIETEGHWTSCRGQAKKMLASTG